MRTNALRSTIQWPASTQNSGNLAPAKTWNPSVPLQQVSNLSHRLLLATLPALAIIIAAAWAVSTFETPRVLHALVWASGFVFLALAVDTSKPNFGSLFASGLALLSIAVLSTQVAAEFALIGAALVAVWVFTAILKQ